MLGQINTFISVLSDAEVHFTPEFPISSSSPAALTTCLHLASYFVSAPADLNRAARTLAISPFAILQAFDEAFDHTFTRSEPFRQAMYTLGGAGEQLTLAPPAEPTGPPAPPTTPPGTAPGDPDTGIPR